MLISIYKRREGEEGNYDFVAMFAKDCEQSEEWIEQIKEWLLAEGELPLVVDGHDPRFGQILPPALGVNITELKGDAR